uniref:Uncharacterized protein n=1 Tax=Roseihalotalea indica TaxID=2867963 RepID=A0AA49JK60_9BACT|nr:hypothetical protein K4G66_15710 [Tunicatimonas sp. TK19036]
MNKFKNKKSFIVITGGPGIGKTAKLGGRVLKILAFYGKKAQDTSNQTALFRSN